MRDDNSGGGQSRGVRGLPVDLFDGEIPRESFLGDHPDVRVAAEAADVRAALQALLQHQIDVVFLDIHLPDGDGFDLLELAGPLGVRPRVAARTRPHRIPVPGPTGTRFVDTRSVVQVRAERNYVRLVVADRAVLLRSTLREVEDRLPPGEFVRVNRSTLVRIAVIVEVQTLPHGEVSLSLTTGELVITGRSYTAAVRTALGF